MRDIAYINTWVNKNITMFAQTLTNSGTADLVSEQEINTNIGRT